MDFWIQASNPRINNDFDSEDESLNDAVQTVFPLHAEAAFIIWNGTWVPLNYKYDVSVILFDLLQMLDKIFDDKTDKYTVRWPSNTFSAEWILQWDESELTINATWDSVLGGLENQLNKAGSITMSRKCFLSEWRRLLINVEKSLTNNGYNVKNFEGGNILNNLIGKINTDGILYNRIKSLSKAENTNYS